MSGRRLKLALGLGLGGVCFWLAFRNVPVPAVWQVLASARSGPLAAAVAAIVAATALRAWRWQRLFPPGDRRVRFGRLWPILVVGQMVNILVPARAGDVVRLFAVEREERRAPGETLGTIALEKTLASLWVDLPGAVDTAALALAGMLGVALTAMALAAAAGEPAVAAIERVGLGPERLRRRIVESWLRPLVGAFAGRWRPGSWAITLVLSTLVWVAAAVANYCCLAAVGLEASAITALVVLLVLQIGFTVPVSPGGLGVFEYLSVLALSLFAVPRAEAVAFGVLLHAVAYLTPMAMGAVFVAFHFAPLPGDVPVDRPRRW